MCGYERGVLLLGLFPPKTQTEKTEGTPLPTISAGVPRIEKDPHGGDVVIVPVRPYAKDMDRCTRCEKHVRPYDRLGVRRWRHLDIGCASVLLQCLFDRFGSVFPQCGLMVFPGVVIVSR